MCQTAQNAAFALEPLFAALPHQRNIENLHRYAPLKPSVASFRQPDRAHSAMADLRNQSVNTKGLTNQASPSWQLQTIPFEETFLRQRAMLTKEYFQFTRQSRDFT